MAFWISLGGDDLVEEAVDAVADHQPILGRLDVDITGPFVESVLDDVIDEFDYRGLLGLFPQSFRVDLLLFLLPPGLHLGIEKVAQDAPHLLGLFMSPEGAHDGLLDAGPGGDHRADLTACQRLQGIDGQDVKGIRHGQGEPPSLPGEGEDLVTVQELLGEEGKQRGVYLPHTPLEVHAGDAQLSP